VLSVLCRSSVAALALVCALLVGSGGALAAGSNGSSGSGSSGSSGSSAASGSGSGQGSPFPSSGGGPLSPGLSTPGTPTPTTATQTQTQATNATTTAGGGGSLSQTSVFGIVIGAVIVIGGVCLYIFRDARRRAPSRGRRADAGAGGAAAQSRVPGSKRVKPRKLSPQERKRRRRGRAPRRK
jgi:hypothetical protein